MTNINTMPAIAATPKALKGRPDVKQGCNPCDKTQAIAANRPANLRSVVNDCKSIVYKTSNSLKTKTKRPKTLLLLLLLMGLTATPKAFAQTQVGNVIVDGVNYTLWSDHTASIGGPQTVSGTLTLHETVAYQGTNYTLTRIEDDAFAYYQRNFTGSLIIPATVTSIGYYAFRFATFTGELHLPESLISIGIDAFNSCGFTGTLTLPAQLTEIPDRAFYGNNFTGDLTIPDNVTNIGQKAFQANNFSSLTVGNGSTPVTIEKEAFYASTITQLNLGRKVVSIGDKAFRSRTLDGATTLYINCLSGTPPQLGSEVFKDYAIVIGGITVPCGSTEAYLDPSYNWLYNGASIFSVVEAAIQNVCINDVYYELICDGHTATVIYDPSYATLEWASIEDVEYEGVQYAVTAIADGTFDWCTNLEGVSCHAPQLATIGVNAFRGCTNLGSFGLYNCATPPALGRGAFTIVPLADMLLGVPYCSQYAYSQHEVFGQCGNIQGYDGCEYNFWNQYGEGDGLWSNPANWMDANQEVCTEVPGEGAQVAIFAECEIDVDVTVGSITAGSMDETAPVTVKTGKTLTATNYIYTANDPENLIIEDGAQVVQPNAGAKATVEKNITAYTPNTKNGYHLIGHSFADNGAVSDMDNLLANDYDLYYYDEPTHYWMNQKQTANNFTELEAAKGYLYANSASQTIGLKGTLNAANALVNIPLSYEADALKGFNLVGNPFAHNVTTFTSTNVATEVYRMNGTKDNLMVSTISASDPLKPGEGFFVKATGDGASITFNAQTRGEVKATEPAEVPTITLNLTQNGLLVDRFILKRDGEPLEKFSLNENATRIYATEGGKDYAVATVGDVCRDVARNVSVDTDVARYVSTNEIPLHFKAAQNGTYTLTFDTQNLDLDYLHLIDNMTGADIDLLSPAGHPPFKGGRGDSNEPRQAEYTFEAKTTDYASRFRLVFSTPADETSANRPFAYIADGEIRINEADARGASLQVVDVMGRVIVTKDVARNVSTNGMTPGVYVLRLINGDNVRTQKIVVE